jgi:signal transduction histidine kinase/ActR/RegA family two-component response regulator
MKLLNNSLHDIWHRLPIAWLVLMISLIATWWGWFMVKEASQQQIKNTVFDYRVERIKGAITTRMLIYQQMLQGCAALFAASVAVERHEWHDYIETLHLDKYYPGVQGVGFSKRILPHEKANHIAEIRAEGGFFQNYTIKPEGEREEYTSVVYLEPLDKRNQQAIGYDMFAETTRRTAMERARDTGEPALSGKVTLLMEIDQDIQAGFLLYLPVYRNGQPHNTVAERRAALVGYVYSPFRMNDLMHGILGGQSLGIDFHLYDGDNSSDFSPNRFMYDKDSLLNPLAQFTRIDTLVIAGHPWTFHFATLPEFDAATKTYTAHIVLVGGIVVSFLLFGIGRSLKATRCSLIAVQQVNARLRTEIDERLKVEIELLCAKGIAEVANHAKSTFLANMSHELRTPLNGILGYAQILSWDDNLTADQKEGLQIIEKSGDYLLTLINDILDLAKVEAGKVELFPKAVLLENFLQEIVQLFQLRAEEKGICFSYQPQSELPMVIEVDEKRLRQVLINLLGNAIKFTEQGKVTLTVSYQEDKLGFHIQDQGCGIAAADLERIFQPFQQVGDKKYWGQGTGLGLPITKKLVDMMDGELRVTSTLGQGCIFSVFLHLSEVSNLLHSTGDSKLPKIIGYQGRPRTVLVIDDNSVNRSILVKMLTHLGFTLLEAANGQEGLDKAWKTVVMDLILVDLVMPDLDGFAVIQQLRQIPHCRETVLIAVSASAFETDRQKSLDLGGTDFIAKPVKFDRLLEQLRMHLNLTWLYEETTAVSTSSEGLPLVLGV